MNFFWIFVLVLLCLMFPFLWGILKFAIGIWLVLFILGLIFGD